MLGYIREAETSKETWDNLRNISEVNTAARKLQLCHELNNMQQRDMSVTSYTLKMKELCDSLGWISVNVDDDQMVQICLGSLAPHFGAMWTANLGREKHPSFDLQSMLLVEENHVWTRSNASEGHMIYTHLNGGRGRGRARRQFGQGQRKTRSNLRKQLSILAARWSHQGTFGRRGSFHSGPSQQNATECGYCRKLGHHEEAWIDFHKPTTHELRDQLWLRRPWRNVRDER